LIRFDSKAARIRGCRLARERPMSLYAMVSIVLALSGAALFGLTLLFRMPVSDDHRIREEPVRAPGGAEYWRIAGSNAVLSIALVYGLIYLLYDAIFYESAASGWRMAWEGFAILISYDFAYYLVHRYPFHRWRWLRRIHAVHHTIRHPTAVDSLYLHPVENAIGLALLMLCTFLVGPVSIHAFAAVFVVYSLLNIVNHAGLELRRFPFRTLSTLARKHDRHHVSMRAGNFASITPLFDHLFGTAE
jgi:sterol desaturase/sphingolipid hydroxylase (fatty acid hydroxylase superfamily)